MSVQPGLLSLSLFFSLSQNVSSLMCLLYQSSTKAWNLNACSVLVWFCSVYVSFDCLCLGFVLVYGISIWFCSCGFSILLVNSASSVLLNGKGIDFGFETYGVVGELNFDKFEIWVCISNAILSNPKEENSCKC